MVAVDIQVKKGREPLDLTERERSQVVIQEDQAGELGLLHNVLSTTVRGL